MVMVQVDGRSAGISRESVNPPSSDTAPFKKQSIPPLPNEIIDTIALSLLKYNEKPAEHLDAFGLACKRFHVISEKIKKKNVPVSLGEGEKISDFLQRKLSERMKGYER